MQDIVWCNAQACVPYSTRCTTAVSGEVDIKRRASGRNVGELDGGGTAARIIIMRYENFIIYSSGISARFIFSNDNKKIIDKL